MRADFFHRLPPPTAILLLSALLDLTTAQILPLPRRTPPPTTTLAHHALNVVPFPLLAATPAPQNPFDLRRRQDGLNTVCGYIGGNSELPATCGVGSHCVMDVDNNVVGCCPNGQATCTEGIYTGCVDGNSGPQSVVNPYVFTCQGDGNVCYQNFFDGGMSMFGCGTASDLGTTVLATATLGRPSGRPTGTTFSRLSETRISIKTVLRSTASTKSSSRSSTQSSTTSLTTSSTTSQPTSSTATTSSRTPDPTSAPAGSIPVASGSSDRLGPIIGGSLGGAAVLLAVLAFALFFFRRRRNNARQGPGPSSLKTTISPPRTGTGSGFEPLHQSSEAFETGLPTPVPAAQAYGHPGAPGAPSPFTYLGAAAPHASYPPAGGQHVSYPPMQQQQGYQYPGQFPAAYAGGAVPNPVFAGAGVAMGTVGAADSDSTPLTAAGGGGYTDAVGATQPHTLDRIGEEDEEERTAGSGQDGGGGDNRPLWQQNRRQSRNQVWM